jgi:glycosyltransferase involved in cell wall biosynthesis
MARRIAPQQVEDMVIAAKTPNKIQSITNVLGINVAGYLRDESGWGAAGRGYIRALRGLGIPLALNDLSSMSTNRSLDRTLRQFDQDHPYDMNLICIDASQHFGLLSRVQPQYFRDRYNIGAWAWELPHFPENWFNRFAYYDEIWTTTSFVANALAPIAPIPVVCIPPVLTQSGQSLGERGRKRLGIRSDEFVYLFVFDFHSHLARKNPLGIIDAFQLAFAPSDTVRLVIKCVNAGADPDGWTALNARANTQSISIYDGYWAGKDMQDLMAMCDVYVSLHRSEGTGLTITDAMALGKPVIATGWSGNMDFMNVTNSYPIRHDLVEIQETVGPYRAGEMWAEPSVQHAAELMRHVFEERDEAKARGKRAKQDIEDKFSETHIAGLIQERLIAIAQRRRLKEFRQEAWDAFFAYQRSICAIRQIVMKALPPKATVMVVSKGDDELLRLDGRTGWHFPQNENGVYVGHHPSDSAAAIEHLEALRKKGGDYLLFPSTAFWWLDHYQEFKSHLDEQYPRTWDDEECVIYSLHPSGVPYNKRFRPK